MGPGMPQILNHPKAAVEGGKECCMERQIDDSLEMSVGGVFGIGRAVPTDRHGEGCEGFDGWVPHAVRMEPMRL